MAVIDRPEVVEDQHLEHLDELRKDNEMNMMGGASEIIDAFGLSRSDAGTVHTYWMKTFGRKER